MHAHHVLELLVLVRVQEDVVARELEELRVERCWRLVDELLGLAERWNGTESPVNYLATLSNEGVKAEDTLTLSYMYE